MIRRRSMLLAGLAVPCACGPALAAERAAASGADDALTEWPVPWQNSRPRDPFAETATRIWFVGQRGNYLATLDAGSGAFAKFDLPPRALPHNVIVDAEGAAWYAGNGDAHIGRLDPATGRVEKIAMPDPAARDPHTLTFDAAGAIWFTVQGGNFVGRLDPAGRAVRLVAVPTPEARPYGIKVDGQGRPWFVEFGANKLGWVDPATLALTEVTLPRAEARPRRLEIAADGAVWYVDYAGGMIGRHDPAAGATEEWPAPGGAGAQPYGTALDDRGLLWFVEFGAKPARFVAFDTGARKVVAIRDIPSGGGVRHMHYHAPSQAVWFGTDSGTIGRLRVRAAA